MNQHHTSSSTETKRIAASLAKRILRSGLHKIATVLALTGELGSGKTTFVQGFLRGLGVQRGGASPTFVLMKRYALRDSRLASIYHIDAYRVKKPKEFLALGLKGILADPKNIVLIEWAENVKKLLPRNAIKICFSHKRKLTERIIEIKD